MNLRMQPEEFLREYEHTWCRHRGVLEHVADVFGTSRSAIEVRISRMRRAGYEIRTAWSEAQDES
ncbi:MAG: hypothetical protein ACR2JS_04965 [Candidatus Nanopelagicales bacterium]